MKSKTKILLVEDDPNLGAMLNDFLNIKGGFDISYCKDGRQAKQLFLKEDFDLCLFDIMLPKIDGFSLASELRLINKYVPLIFITAKSLLEDKKRAFELGGDDYLCKPFSMDELMMRINAVMRRSKETKFNNSTQTTYKVDSMTFNYDIRKVEIGNKLFSLTSKESDLLKILLDYKNRLVDRATILQRIWKDDNYFNARSMDVYLSKVRKIINKVPSLELINVHGVGYKLVFRKLKG